MTGAGPSASPAPAAAPRRGILAVLAFVVVIHAGWWLVADPAVRYGDLADSDAYARLVRVERLLDGGGWFDVSLPRANAPDGGSLHWTRPLDALLIALALPLMPPLGVKAALYWSGALISPLLHLGVAAALAWAAAPLVGGAAALIAGALTATQFGILGYAVVGRADHHVLLALAAVVAFGFMVRAFVADAAGGGRPAAAAGVALAFGLWVAVEAQVMAALCVAAMGLEWVLAGDRALARNRRLVLGLFLGVAAAVVIERGPSGMLAVEYDRVSVVHVTAAAAALAFWSAIGWLGRRRRGPSGVMTRLLAAIGGAAVVLAALRLLFPRLLANPITDFDPEFLAIVERTAELGPIADAWHFLLYVGAAVPALPWGVWRARGEWPGRRRWPWLLTLGLAAAYAALATTWQRWAMLADLFLVVLVADAMVAVDAAVERRLRAPARVVAKAAALLLIAVGPLAIGAAGVYAAMPAPSPAAGVAGDPRPCPLQPLARFLAAPPWGDRPRTIVASPNFGAELLYRTRHRVVATVHHRNRAGIVDGVRILGGVDDAAIRKLVEKRRVELVLICRRGHDAYARKGDGDDVLYRRLESGAPPAWLEPVALPEGLASRFGLFRVRAPR